MKIYLIKGFILLRIDKNKIKDTALEGEALPLMCNVFVFCFFFKRN